MFFKRKTLNRIKGIKTPSGSNLVSLLCLKVSLKQDVQPAVTLTTLWHLIGERLPCQRKWVQSWQWRATTKANITQHRHSARQQSVPKAKHPVQCCFYPLELFFPDLQHSVEITHPPNCTLTAETHQHWAAQRPGVFSTTTLWCWPWCWILESGL